jgi:homogentisate 1,2-dioxygenase
MTFYLRQGVIPGKKHTTFFQKDGSTLYREELMSSQGFHGVYSTLYHAKPPTKVRKIEPISPALSEIWRDAPFVYYHFITGEKRFDGPPHLARIEYLKNREVSISTARPTVNSHRFYKNAGAHELIFIHHGSGACYSQFGKLDLSDGDYLVLPKGTIYQLQFQNPGAVKLLIVESAAPFEIPGKFRNEFGQLMEHAPYSERDFRSPVLVPPDGDYDDYLLDMKKGERYLTYHLDHHPFDVVGWDGYHYPFTFNIEDYAPIVGKIHQPPPVHMVFSTPHFVVCNFVPRLLDFHPHSVPAPYYHSNVDCDEVLYYVSGNFTSRKGITEGSITLHPMGIPHGPQPGRVEASLGKEKTDEVAIMIDTFSPLSLTCHVKETMVEDYYRSWLE